MTRRTRHLTNNSTTQTVPDSTPVESVFAFSQSVIYRTD
jgi:hypothetical protein